MRTSIVFGEGWLDVELPDHTREADAGVSTRIDSAASTEAAVDAALAAPLGMPPLSECARGARRVTIAFDDPTVPCFAPLWEVAVGRVLEELRRAGVAGEQVRLLCANALHRKFTREELAGILGERIVREHGERLACHDAENPEELVHLGTTAAGHDVEVSRAVTDSDLLVYVNASSFRGFNGGWKSICVGLSTWRSIRWHHTPELMTMSMDRSPMHEILGAMGEVVESRVGPRRIFKVETLLANPFEVGRVWAGTVGDTRRAVLEAVRAGTRPRREMLDARADIVVYGVPDWSPYAAYSTMNPLLTLLSTGLGYLGGVVSALGKPGCSVVMATPCPDRWDEARHPSYRETWERVLPACGRDPHVALRRFAGELASRQEYVDAYRNGHGFHPVHPLMGLFPLTRLRHAPRVHVAGIQAPELARHAGLIPAASVEEALAEAMAHHGRDAAITLVRNPPAINRQLPA